MSSPFLPKDLVIAAIIGKPFFMVDCLSKQIMLAQRTCEPLVGVKGNQ